MKKRIYTVLLSLIIAFVVLYNLDFISEHLAYYFYSTPTVAVPEKNRFSKEINYSFVEISEDFIPYNYQELLNIFYTVLDAGYEKFTFYCPSEYEKCIDDVKYISNPKNVDILTTIGNFVSPYNNFQSLNVIYDPTGEITIEVIHLYNEQDIANITNEIDRIWKSIVTKDMQTQDIIYAFHDYIINHTRYDEIYESELAVINKEIAETGASTKKTTHQSNKANGPLFEGYAICSGYTDTMAILLDKLGVKNFKVASNTHVWNVVYLDGAWKHIDLTWDDPLSQEDKTINYLEHKFYLIDTPTLEKYDITDHTFNKSYYLELK